MKKEESARGDRGETEIARGESARGEERAREGERTGEEKRGKATTSKTSDNCADATNGRDKGLSLEEPCGSSSDRGARTLSDSRKESASCRWGSSA